MLTNCRMRRRGRWRASCRCCCRWYFDDDDVLGGETAAGWFDWTGQTENSWIDIEGSNLGYHFAYMTAISIHKCSSQLEFFSQSYVLYSFPFIHSIYFFILYIHYLATLVEWIFQSICLRLQIFSLRFYRVCGARVYIPLPPHMYDLRIFLFLIMVKGMRGSVRVVVVVRGSYANKFEQ